MADKPRNVGASIRARLQNLAAQKSQVFDIPFTRYAHERFMYCLSRSQFAVAQCLDRPGASTNDVLMASSHLQGLSRLNRTKSDQVMLNQATGGVRTWDT